MRPVVAINKAAGIGGIIIKERCLPKQKMTCASEVRKYYPSLGVAAGAALILLLGCWAAPADSSAGFTRSWAVEIVGGIEAADALAEKYGFTNIGQVCLRTYSPGENEFCIQKEGRGN